MLKSMKSEQSELLSTQTNVEESQNREVSSELLEREAVNGTPFWIVGNQDEGYFLAFNKYKLTHKKSKKAVLDELNFEMWNIVSKLVILLMEIKAESDNKEAKAEQHV